MIYHITIQILDIWVWRRKKNTLSVDHLFEVIMIYNEIMKSYEYKRISFYACILMRVCAM